MRETEKRGPTLRIVRFLTATHTVQTPGRILPCRCRSWHGAGGPGFIVPESGLTFHGGSAKWTGALFGWVASRARSACPFCTSARLFFLSGIGRGARKTTRVPSVKGGSGWCAPARPLGLPLPKLTEVAIPHIRASATAPMQKLQPQSQYRG